MLPTNTYTLCVKDVDFLLLSGVKEVLTFRPFSDNINPSEEISSMYNK